jgi:phosphoserine phosphatase
VVVADLEGTLSAAYTWQGMRDYLEAHGGFAAYRRFFWRSLPRLLLFRVGIGGWDFRVRWVLGILALLNGRSRAEMAAMGAFVAERTLWPARREPVVAELNAHLAAGRRVIVVSGMFEPILAGFLTYLPGAEAIGTPLRYENDIFCGEIAATLNRGPEKAAQLQRLVTDGPLLAAYGDTAADIPMLALAADGVAVHPDAPLRKEAAVRGWRILE